MNRKTLPMILVCLMLGAAIAAVSALSTPHAAANQVLQDVPRLDGYQLYFSESSGEASRFDREETGLSRLAGLLELQGAELHTLEWRTGIPADADLIVMAGLTRDLSAEQTAWLWTYLQDGGRLLLIADPVVGSGRNVTGLPGTSGLFQLLWSDMGLRGRDDMVVVESGEIISVIPPVPGVRAGEPTPVPLPPVNVPRLLLQFTTGYVNTGHPIGDGFTDTLTFFGARSIEVDGTPRETQVISLVFSDANFYGETNYNVYLTNSYVEYNIGEDTGRENLALAGALEDITQGTRVILIGDREFAINGYGLQTSPPYSSSFLYPGNARFLLRSVAWLLDADMTNTVDLTFPTPGPTSTPTITPSPAPTVTPVPADTDTDTDTGS